MRVSGALEPSESAQSERTEPVRLWCAAGRIHDPPSSSLQRRCRALAALASFVGDPVRERLTLAQSLEVLLALLESLPSASKAGLLHAKTQVSTLRRC